MIKHQKIIPGTKTRNFMINMHNQNILMHIKNLAYQTNHNIETVEVNPTGPKYLAE